MHAHARALHSSRSPFHGPWARVWSSKADGVPFTSCFARQAAVRGNIKLRVLDNRVGGCHFEKFGPAANASCWGARLTSPSCLVREICPEILPPWHG